MACVRAQDAITWNVLNIKKENGGQYIAYVWDNAYWGNQVKLYQLTGRSAYASEVRYGQALMHHTSGNWPPQLDILFVSLCMYQGCYS